MAGINLDELLEEEPGDGWHWDPSNPPDEFTTSMIRRMSISAIRELQEPGNGILNEAQQRSFDAAFEEWWAPTRLQLASIVAAVMPKFDFNSTLGASLKASMEGLRKQTAAQLAASTRIDRSVERLLPKASVDLHKVDDFLRPRPPARSRRRWRTTQGTCTCSRRSPTFCIGRKRARRAAPSSTSLCPSR